MLACLALTVFVSVPPVPPSAVGMQWHAFKFCESERYLSNDAPMGHERSDCDLAAQWYLWGLQMAGTLPGSKEAMMYTVHCTSPM